MDSVTKRQLDEETIASLVKSAFGVEQDIKKIKELTDGYFNNSYLIELKSGKKTVLKIAPEKTVKVLRYERELMKTEVSVLKQLAALKNIPVPSVLYNGEEDDVVSGDFFFMEYLEGTPLNKVKEQMSKEEIDELYATLGSYARYICSVTSDYFGFMNLEERRYKSWADCFEAMIEDILEDAKDENIQLPLNDTEIMVMIKGYRDTLEEVRIPVLLHKDLWDGNIFVDPRTYKITGIIDCERAIYSDPLMEIVFGFCDQNIPFLKAYLGRTQLSKSEICRINLYKFYLFLILTIECPYRQYNDRGAEKWARDMLDQAIKELQ